MRLVLPSVLLLALASMSGAVASCGRSALDEPVATTGAAGDEASAGHADGTEAAAGAASVDAGRPQDLGAPSTGCAPGDTNETCPVCTPGSATCNLDASPPDARDATAADALDAAGTDTADALDGDVMGCMTGATECVGGAEQRTCVVGMWSEPSSCALGCNDGLCSACVPNQTACASTTDVKTCGTDGQWDSVGSCPLACVNDACGQDPKRVFTTSTTYVGGDLGGLDGADAKCQARAVAAGLAGTFRAWLSDPTGSPSSRFTQNGGPYELVDGTIVANNWTALLTNPHAHALDETEFGGSPPAGTAQCAGPAAWTNTNDDGTLGDPSQSCDDWSDPADQDGSSWGNPESVLYFTTSCDGAWDPTACASKASLYCIEQ